MGNTTAVNTLHDAIIRETDLEETFSRYTFEELVARKEYQLPNDGHTVSDNALSLAVRYGRSRVVTAILHKFLQAPPTTLISYDAQRLPAKRLLQHLLMNTPLLHLAVDQCETEHSIKILKSLLETAAKLGLDMKDYVNQLYEPLKYKTAKGYILTLSESHLPYSPLHLAAMRGSIFVTTLLHAGADYELPIQYSGKSLYAYAMPLKIEPGNDENTYERIDLMRNSIYAFVTVMQARHDKISFDRLKDDIVTLLADMYNNCLDQEQINQTKILPVIKYIYERLYTILALERDRRRTPEMIIRQLSNFPPHEPTRAKKAREDYDGFTQNISAANKEHDRASVLYSGL